MKQAILAVSFGTSYPEAERSCILHGIEYELAREAAGSLRVSEPLLETQADLSWMACLLGKIAAEEGRPLLVKGHGTEHAADKTYDNEQAVRQMVGAQRDMRIPSDLIPRCPVCGAPMSMNLRCDDTFVQDVLRYAAQQRYEDFLQAHAHSDILFMELGVGFNTPGIIKLPFRRMTAKNPQATYACLNKGEAFCPDEISDRSICINRNLKETLENLL